MEILWTTAKWENPFIPRPIVWRGRELYPARFLQRQVGIDRYKAYVDEFGDEFGPSDESEGSESGEGEKNAKKS